MRLPFVVGRGSVGAAAAQGAHDPVRVLLIDDDEDEASLTRSLLGRVEHTRYELGTSSRTIADRAQCLSGLPALDALLGGGIEEGSSTLIVGPPGTGKSSLAAQFVSAACRRGEGAAMFLFEESASNLLHRTDGLGLSLRPAGLVLAGR